ncbi:MAG TPA: NAD-dependent epimerase/dehydratase family protein [Thermoanaerobaculia bacterium]|jgi:dTDP-L-rhamnose 4-epimerase|nr:NAD-dependent epimerase/dehydratase family protein [Thermoanaerobaculia bacterium]
MKGKVLITGGAGFIGSHLADELLRRGYPVRALDVLTPQVHPERKPPEYLDPEVELMVGDVRDPAAVRRALQGVEGVFHLAAAVGVGQSMYEIAEYTSVNNLGTAVLLEALVEKPVARLVVASSMSLYGEGLYVDESGRVRSGLRRDRAQLQRADWEVRDEEGRWLSPVPTPESKAPDLSSVYALSKYDQERLCLMIGETYGIPAVALRFFNAYGPRQALSNPYTGVLAIFASRLLNGNPPLIFEDGEQRRDFVSVHDVVQGCRLAYESPGVTGEVFNVGSGESFSIRELAERMAEVLGLQRVGVEVTGKYRAGDIRHCFSDISRAREILGYAPRVAIEEGLQELAEWLPRQQAVDRVSAARDELASRGLTL